jgi:hypothetical protein
MKFPAGLLIPARLPLSVKLVELFGTGVMLSCVELAPRAAFNARMSSTTVDEVAEGKLPSPP